MPHSAVCHLLRAQTDRGRIFSANGENGRGIERGDSHAEIQLESSRQIPFVSPGSDPSVRSGRGFQNRLWPSLTSEPAFISMRRLRLTHCRFTQPEECNECESHCPTDRTFCVIKRVYRLRTTSYGRITEVGWASPTTHQRLTRFGWWAVPTLRNLRIGRFGVGCERCSRFVC
jgi:hypothetical protein